MTFKNNQSEAIQEIVSTVGLSRGKLIQELDAGVIGVKPKGSVKQNRY